MMHATEDDLVLRFYGEADPRESARLEEHLATCAACRDRAATLDRTMTLVTEAMPAPDRGEDYAGAVWRRLRPAIAARALERDRSGAGGWRRLVPNAWLDARRLAFAGGLAVLLVAAFLAGRYAPRTDGPAVAPSVETAAPGRILLLAVGEHLERSQMILIELTHAGGDGTIDISSQQARARDLVDANRLYRQTAARTGDLGVSSVLDDLERLLLEIVHEQPQISAARLQDLQQRIEAQGLLFKVRVIGTRVREGSRPPEA